MRYYVAMTLILNDKGHLEQHSMTNMKHY